MKIKIHVTKEIYRKSMMCGIGEQRNISSNCAISNAVRDIAPRAMVGLGLEVPIIWWDDTDDRCISTNLTKKEGLFIHLFDHSTPEERLYLPEFSFEVDFPDELVEEIGIDQVTKILEESKTLERV